MIYIAVLYVFGVVLYNLQPENANNIIIDLFGNKVPIWRFHINFLRSFITACAFFELSRVSIQKPKKAIYTGVALFASLTTLFHCCLLIGASGIEEWIHEYNNPIWAGISGLFGIAVLILLSYKLYDKRR